MLLRILPEAHRSPFVAEQIAIDVTNGLRAAATGLRGFRSRPLLSRLWDGITGQGQELQAAIGSDLVVVQQATVELVREVMSEGSRTQYCVERVLRNLLAVNADFDGLVARVAELEEAVRRLQTRQDLLEMKSQADALYAVGELHPGTGLIFGSSLYLAHVTRLYSAAPDLLGKGRSVTLSTIRRHVGEKPEALPILFAKALEQVRLESLETVAYLASDRPTPTLRVFGTLSERRVVGLGVDSQVIEDALIVVRKLHDPEGRLGKHLLRPLELIERVADELLAEGADGRVI